ncbi:unnamed protein product [Citrullus colocynthis]|uniref:BZIP domain-containing protein n=1 Tax=Citrullus colocynthis TaxID=252529 RepID=A0ABP0XYB2_9ROSI
MASTISPHQCSTSFDSDDFTSEEHFTAQILLELPLLIQQSHLSLGLSPSWPLRRKRSAVNSPPDSASVIPQRPPPPSSSEDVKESSPTTPLSLNSLPLSRSESDENNTKAKVSKKKASLDKRFQYLETIDKLTHQNQALEGDVEAMKQHYNHLKAINSELKAKKQEMILGGSNNQSEIPEIGTSSSVAMEMSKLTVNSSASNMENHLHQREPSIKNQTAPMAEQSNSNQNFQIPIGPIPLYDSSLGPMGIPDLNLTIDEINFSKYMAARARQIRIRIWKNKNKNNNNGAAKLHS